MAELGALLPFVAIALLFWLLIIRPASRRQKTISQMQSSLEVGNEVMLSSGFYGTIVTIEDDRLRVEIAPGTVVTVARGAIGSVVPPAALEGTDGFTAIDLDENESTDPEQRDAARRDAQDG